MKKFLDKLSTFGCMLPLIISCLVPVALIFIGIWKASNSNIKSFIFNLLAIPFVLIGVINIFRGFGAVLEKDEETLEFKKYWQYVIYFIVTIAGYVALFLGIAQWIKL